MPRSPHNSAGHATFLTVATRDRSPVFQVSSLADRFIETLHALRTRGHFKLHAYVVLPDHIHLVLTPRALRVEEALTLIQSTFAEQLNTPHSIWQPGFVAHPIQSIRNLERVRAYLHEAPVRARLVPSAELYPHSSARRIA